MNRSVNDDPLDWISFYSVFFRLSTAKVEVDHDIPRPLASTADPAEEPKPTHRMPVTHVFSDS